MLVWIATATYIGFIDYDQIAHCEATLKEEVFDDNTTQQVFTAKISLNGGQTVELSGAEAENFWYKLQNRKLYVKPDPATGV